MTLPPANGRGPAGWQLPERSFFAIFPQQHAMPVRMRAFIDFLVEQLRPNLFVEVG